MTKKNQESKLSLQKNKRSLSTRELKQRSNAGAKRKVRVGDVLTDAQGKELIELAMQKAREGNDVLIKALIEQKYGRPVATLEAKVESNIQLTVLNYGESDDSV